jgi:large subunit ribosomal protein L21
MSYAVIKTGGKQYRVAKGDTLTIKVGGDTKGVSVTGEILAQEKGPKLLAYRYKRRKGYHRTVGHRQRLTKVKVTAIG